MTSPHIKGGDVRLLQEQVNRRFRHWKVDHRVEVDGDYGEKTRDATLSVLYGLGVATDSPRKKGITGRHRSVIRRPALRTPNELRRSRSRKGWRTRLRKRYAGDGGAKGVLSWARERIGTTERGNSNWGKPVQDWIKLTGYSYGVPWCGCFCNAALVHGAGLAPNHRLGYVGYIVADAKGRRNGWSWHTKGQPGDLACFGTQHVGIVERPLGGGRYQNIEGNTSAGAGNQADGGGVRRRERSTSGGFAITGFARPPYKR